MSDKKTHRKSNSFLSENDTPSSDENEYVEDVDLYSIDSDIPEDMDYLFEKSDTESDANPPARVTTGSHTENDAPTVDIDPVPNTETFADLLNDEYSLHSTDDADSKNDIFTDELLLNSTREPEESDQLENPILFQEQPLDEIPFDKLIAKESESDNHAELFAGEASAESGHDSDQETDSFPDGFSLDSILEPESDEHHADQALFQGEQLDTLSFEQLIETDAETDNIADLLNEDNSAQSEHDTEQEVDVFNDIFARNPHPYAEGEDQSAADTALLRDELLEELPFDKLIEADSEPDNIVDLLDNNTPEQSGYESEQVADPFTIESTQNEYPETENTEHSENTVFFHDEQPEKLAFDNSIDTDSKSDSSSTLPNDSSKRDHTLEDAANKSLFTKEDTDPLSATVDSRVAHTEAVPSTAIGESYNTVSSAVDSIHEDHSQHQQNQLRTKNDELPGITTNDVSSNGLEIRENAYKPKSKNLIALAICALMVAATAIWYGYQSIGKEPQRVAVLEQDEQRNQQNQDNPLRPALQEAIKSDQTEIQHPLAADSTKDALSDAIEQLNAQKEIQAKEFLTLTTTTKQLEKRLASIEGKLTGHDGKEQADRILELGQQLKNLEMHLQKASRTNHGVTGGFALQLQQLDTSIALLENRVDLIHKRSTPLIATPSEDDPVQAEDPPSAGTAPVHTGSQGVKTPHPDKHIPPESVTHSQPNWAVNLSSHRKRSSAEQERTRFNTLGIEAIIRKARVRGTTWFRVRIEGFPDRKAAQDYIQVQLNKNTIKDAWISRNNF